MSSNTLLSGTLQTIILKLLSEHEKMYGYQITQMVKEITHGEILLTEGALYPALHKMEAAGLLKTEMELVENRARKYYLLTCKGGEQVHSKLAEARNFIENLQLLLKLNFSVS